MSEDVGDYGKCWDFMSLLFIHVLHKVWMKLSPDLC
jgi:hypothetical protein